VLGAFPLPRALPVIASAAKQPISPRDGPPTSPQNPSRSEHFRTGGASGRGVAQSAGVRQRDHGLLRFANKKQTVIPLIFLYKLGTGKEK
jgi:hypothetical protein